MTDEAQVAGMWAGDGMFRAVCGEGFLAACMDVGPLERCTPCQASLRARTQLRHTGERANRPSWFSRLCHRRHQAGEGSSA